GVGEIAADGARQRDGRIGVASDLPAGRHGAPAAQYHRDRRTAGQQSDQVREEFLALVLVVVRLCHVLVRLDHLHRDDGQPDTFEALQDGGDQAARDRVRLENDQRVLDRRRRHEVLQSWWASVYAARTVATELR